MCRASQMRCRLCLLWVDAGDVRVEIIRDDLRDRGGGGGGGWNGVQFSMMDEVGWEVSVRSIMDAVTAFVSETVLRWGD